MPANQPTPADQLREAAQKMRARANAATPGPWVPDVSEIYSQFQGGPWVGETLAVDDPALTEANSTHIASWHPAVALAVADWLDSVAHAIHAGDPDDLLGFGEPTAAFAVARAYLGTTEQVTA